MMLDPSIKRSKISIALIGAMVGVLGLLLGFHRIYSPDIGFQLSLGRWIVEHRSVPWEDPFTYTLGHRPYVDLQWLYQVGLWFVYCCGGTFGLLLVNTLLTLTASAIVLIRRFRSKRRLNVIDISLVTLFFMGNQWEIRPHVVSWIYLGCLMLILEEYQRRPGRIIWFVPICMFFWVNTHSLYILGFAAIGSHVLFAFDRRLTLAAVISGFFCLLNPYGIDGAFFPFVQWKMLQTGTVFKETGGIREFASPFSMDLYTSGLALTLYRPFLFKQLFGLVSIAGLLAGFRRMSRADRLSCVLFAYVFMTGRKNFGYFALVVMPYVSAGFCRAGELAAGWAGTYGAFLRRTAYVILATVTVVFCLVVFLQLRSGYFYAVRRTGDMAGHTFNADLLPVEAAKFIDKARVPAGRMLNSIGDGGYLAFAIERHVFADGRLELAGPEFYKYYMATLTPEGLGRAIREHSVDYAVVPFGDIPIWLELLEAHPMWRCVHLDGRNAVYFRKQFAPWTASFDGISGMEGLPSFSEAEIDAIFCRQLNRGNPAFWESLAGYHYYPVREMRLCAALLRLGYPVQAVNAGIEGLQKSAFEVPGLLLNLGNALWESGDCRRAVLCYRSFLDNETWLSIPPDLKRHAEMRLSAR